jgi:hypothetical protein
MSSVCVGGAQVNLTSVHSSTQGCFYYMPDEYNLYNVVSAALDVFR